MKTWHWLLIICVVGAVLRIALPAHTVFNNDHVNYFGPDSYWRMDRAREVIESGNYGFNYDSLLAVFGQAAIIVPVLLAVGVMVMVYFIGRRLFGSRAGLIAAVFIATWPGEFMARSFIACVDHHALEVFLTTGAALIFILIVTQKNILSWWTLGGVGGIVAMFFVYKNIWSTFQLPFFGQPVQTLITTGETLPLGASLNYIPQVDFALTIIAGIYFLRKGAGWIKWLIAAWGVVMLVATIYQVRFDYYLIVPLSLMMGFALVRMFEGKEVKVHEKAR